MSFLRLLRLWYWLKNLLVLLPALWYDKIYLLWADGEYSLIWTWITFTLVSAGSYIFNDLADVERDRRDPVRSRYKPLARGEVDKQTASFWFAALVVGGLYLAYHRIGPDVMTWEVAYVLLGVLYSLVLKRFGLIGLILVSLGAAFRVLAGAAAIYEPAPVWLWVAAAIANVLLNVGIHRPGRHRKR